MQVDPITHALKAPGIKRLKLKSDDPLSNFAFKFNLRRYTMEALGLLLAVVATPTDRVGDVPGYVRATVGRCRLNR